VGQEFSFVFWRQGGGFGAEFLLGFCVGLRRRRGSRRDAHADLLEEFFLPGWRADAKQARVLFSGVMELVRRIGRNVQGLAGARRGFHAAKRRLDLALEHHESFLEVVAMRRRAASGWDVHVDEAEFSGGVFAAEQNGVGVADQADVQRVGRIGLGQHEQPREIVVVRSACGSPGWVGRLG
jgi:hypothetical protein